MGKRTIVVLCAILVVAIGISASAKKRDIDELWGSRLTVRQFLSQVAPELLGAFPSESYDQPVRWGEDRGRAVYVGSDTMATTLSSIEWEFGRWCIQVNTTAFEFVAYNLTSIPVPFSQVVAYLEEDYRFKDSCSSSGIMTAFELAADVSSSCSGVRYRTVGYHWLTFPPGYAPPGVFIVGVTSWIQRWE